MNVVKAMIAVTTRIVQKVPKASCVRYRFQRSLFSPLRLLPEKIPLPAIHATARYNPVTKRDIMVLKKVRLLAGTGSRLAVPRNEKHRSCSCGGQGDGGHGEVVPVSFGLGPPFILFSMRSLSCLIPKKCMSPAIPAIPRTVTIT